MNIHTTYHERTEGIVGFMRGFDGFASLALRLILGPVMIAAGWEKITGDNWFMHAQDSFPFPFNVLPAGLSWFLASWTEFLGGIFLLFGFATRWVAVPLMVTMFVAGWAIHKDNGWAAIAPSNPDPICLPDSAERADSNVFTRFVKCYNVNERTIEASGTARPRQGHPARARQLQLPERRRQHRQAQQRHRIRRQLLRHAAGADGDRRRPLVQCGLLAGSLHRARLRRHHALMPAPGCTCKRIVCVE